MAKRKSPFKDIPNGSLKIVREAGSNTLRATWSQCAPATVKGKYKENKKTKTGVCYKFKQYTVQWWVRYIENNTNSGWVRASETPSAITDRSNLPGGKVTSTFSYPDNAYSVRCDVKAKYETVHKCTDLSLPSFATRTSGELVLKKADVPATPGQPSISVDRDNKITINVSFSTDEISTGTDSCKFEVQESVVKNGSVSYKTFSLGSKNIAKIVFSKASTSFIGSSGNHYLVRVAGYNSSSKKQSTWTDWSDKIYTNPSQPTGLKVVSNTSTSARVTFGVGGYVDSYDVEYATEKKYLGFENEFRKIVSLPEDNKDQLSHAVTMYVSNLEPGNTYYFRARANRSSGESYETSWAPSNGVQLSIGRAPGPPTTYSSKTSAELGETVNLYWVHNSQDGSSQMYAELEIYVNNNTTPIHKDRLIIKNPNWDDENERDKTMVQPIELKENGVYFVDDNNVTRIYDFKDGDIIFWRVRTRGVYEGAEENTTENHVRTVKANYEPIRIVLANKPFNEDVNKIMVSVKSSQTDGEFVRLSRGSSVGMYDVSLDDPRYIFIYPGSNTLLPANEEVEILIAYSYGNGFGDFSALKQITVYQKPEAYIMLKTDWEWDPLDLEDNVTPIEDLPVATSIKQYPFAIIMGSRPETQRVISYNLTIKNAGGEYPVTDIYGQERYVAVGEVLYQNYFDMKSDEDTPNQRTVIFYPSDVVLENGQSYEFKVDVYTVAGLTDDDSVTIPVVLEDQNEFDIMASVEVDQDNITASIVPYCFDVDPNADEDPDETEITIEETLIEEALTSDVLMDVYRIETDGTLTTIRKGVPNTGETVFDQHPSLDYARYRIVARKIYTAKAEYEDFVDEEVGVHSLVIEWDDAGTVPVEGGKENIEYSAFIDDEDPRAATRAGLGSTYSKGFLVLPWNIDTTEEFNPDVSFVEYIGRENPVSYYGTQRGQTASWSTDIDKKDAGTLFRLRRLARHMGDCYVREPSGTGYWANVKVSWSQTHNEPAVPVSITVTRVEPKEDNNAEVE